MRIRSSGIISGRHLERDKLHASENILGVVLLFVGRSLSYGPPPCLFRDRTEVYFLELLGGGVERHEKLPLLVH
jgi:hypothetical protein